jgi:hypothetical protein
LISKTTERRNTWKEGRRGNIHESIFDLADISGVKKTVGVDGLGSVLRPIVVAVVGAGRAK